MIGCLYIVSVTKWDPRVNKAFQIVMVFEHNAYVLAIPHSYRLLRELEYFSVEHEDNYTLKKKKKGVPNTNPSAWMFLVNRIILEKPCLPFFSVSKQMLLLLPR